jgi:hypothetical protein
MSARYVLVALSVMVDAWAIGAGLSASFASAAAAEVSGVLLRLLTRLGVDHDLSERYPAVVAGVRALVLGVGCCVEGIAGWRYSVLIHSCLL